jgi:hypothetical protein
MKVIGGLGSTETVVSLPTPLGLIRLSLSLGSSSALVDNMHNDSQLLLALVAQFRLIGME